MTKLEIAQKCRESAQWVREHGFIKWARTDGKGGHCALGVMEQVMGLGYQNLQNPALYWRVEDFAPDFTLEVARSLPPVVGRGPAYSIAAWNNADYRTSQDLIDHFEGVALALEIQEFSHADALDRTSADGHPELRREFASIGKK